MISIKLLYPKAKKYIKDHKRLTTLISKSLKKITNLKDKEKRKELMGDFYLSMQLVKDWSTGKYKGVSITSVIKIVAGILYFVMPIDAIPDFLLGTGLLDDFTIISYLLVGLKSDLDKYKIYKEKTSLTEKEKTNIIANEVLETNETDNQNKD